MLVQYAIKMLHFKFFLLFLTDNIIVLNLI